MSHNILITGASGYLGGTLLARWSSANLPDYEKLYALTRTEEQAKAVKQYGAEPLTINLKEEASINKTVVDNKITIIYYLIDALNSDVQVHMIKALAQVKKQTGQDVHFLHTTGAKLFSNHSGFPTDRPVSDTDAKLYELQKGSQAPHALMGKAVQTNNIVIDTAEAYGVKSYIFAPCIVYGKGEGFGNIISIQTVAIVQAAKGARAVYKVDSGRPTWPVCHILDNTSLYLELLRKMITGQDLDHGRNGYYLASTGSVAWDDIYAAMAKGLAKRKVVDDENVREADKDVLQRMAKALKCPSGFVPVQVGGQCSFEAEHGKRIGWKPQYPPEYILQAADTEVGLILENLRG